MTKKTANNRDAFTLVELLVVIAIVLAIAALGAAFAPRVSENQNLSRAVDNLEQWLLTAKMRAKRDGLATGIRFVQTQGDANIDPSLKSGGPPTIFSQVQYIQQPDPLSGGWLSANPSPGGGSVPYGGLYLTGGILQSAGGGSVTFSNVDFSLSTGTTPQSQWLVQTGDYLEVRGGGVYLIGNVVAPTPGQPAITINLSNLVAGSYDANLTITTATTNYRILRQPRLLIGEDPLLLPNNFAIDFNTISGTTAAGCNVANGFSGSPEILFSPTGTVVGTNAGTGILWISVYDTTMTPFDINNVGIVGVQSRTGFIGAYNAAPGANPFAYVGTGRDSGL